MLNSPATRWHWRFHFLFLNQAILHSCMVATAVYICQYLTFILDIHQLFCWIMLVCIYRYAFRHILGFYPPFLYLGKEHVHDQHVLTHGMYLPFCFFMSCPEPAMGISGVGSFPVQSGGSLIIIFQLLSCRHLSLNRFFLLFLRGRHVFTLRGHLYAPICLYVPCTFVCPLYIWTPPYVQTPPYVPNAPLCICMF